MNFHDLLIQKRNDASFVLSAAGLHESMFARFRAAWFEDGLVHVRTRTGGGNRECYAEDGDCSGCYHTTNDMLAKLPNFVSDTDDDFDSTYAVFCFEPLEQYAQTAKEQSEHIPTMGEAFEAFKERISR